MEMVTTCCKVIMIVVNKYTEVLCTIIVGMETGLPIMEWQYSVVTATERQSWLKKELTTIENILINLFQRECEITCTEFVLSIGKA